MMGGQRSDPRPHYRVGHSVLTGCKVDDLIAEFLTETAESLEVVDSELVKFEANPNERKTLDNIFRLVHTIKGTCGFLGLGRLEAVAHAGETLLGRFRDGKLEVTPTAVTLVLHSIDRIKLILNGLEQTGNEPDGDDEDLISQLEAMAEGREVAIETVQPVQVPDRPINADIPEVVIAEVKPELERPLRPGEVSLDELEAAFLAAEAPDWMSDPEPEPVAEIRVEAPKAEPKPEPKIEAPAAPAPKAEPVEAASGALAAALGDENGGIATTQSIRVSVDVLEGLMTLVSEMVLTRNQLLQISRNREDSAFATPLQRLSTLTGELQDSVMKTRMQPIGAAWKKLPRLVRDLSHELGKKIDLIMEGEGTELDRQVLELIRDPLTHMVRNSADHGLEPTEERIALGKPANGQVKLAAFHEGGYIVIRISDNGRGLNTARIREKIVEKGLATRAEVDGMNDQQIHRYIFAPGFSTAAKVTNLSGRGVGMDVVRTNIEQIGGQIDLNSIAGQGTTFTIKIPLTLAIVSALIVGAGGQKFAVPQTSVMELVRTGTNAEHKIEKINDALVLRLRDKLLPLVQLGPTLQLEAATEENATFVMVIQVGERRYGLVVNDVLDTEEIVVKPLASILRDVDIFSGATILGDGSVVLILDPNALSERAGNMLEEKVEESAEDAVAESAQGQKVAMLLFRAGGGAPKAVELEHITRLEHIEAEKIERMDGRAALQYRGKLMPILNVADAYGFKEQDIQPLLVFTGEGYAMALAVDEIVDVVEDFLNIELSPDRPGVRGTAVITGRACEILDVDHYLLRGLAEHARRQPAQDLITEAA
ncbi:CheA signal transduction histidine kinase [Asticcacaulis excentricus CB 48]|uniref:Chemotaxis protein CheA n=1 Tax=Asticcacaulis excentricus (strain ATCC 15261 / DSM 4724 / KCTC 12464 / NCIMB 9791 / VKM B-1370 / CB 48) TaxID=573065 RepID=E8RRB2_ASTEC|nr:CheA signal transduction histidine kinase [Asticcacaulis excentricus CB 48]